MLHKVAIVQELLQLTVSKPRPEYLAEYDGVVLDYVSNPKTRYIPFICENLGSKAKINDTIGWGYSAMTALCVNFPKNNPLKITVT